ncbi:hypothetical protein IB238_03070 [Rhizobium sp. ARZ01]|uniref:hypothetical protein n=1 Tax=Rhizobium sp. ARZ01 TaxID=2769313 RepID=UPI00177C4CC0|nr:hypothetical protein [Rhizobium sp. ARZ01]MBD9371623.1 hypothetical protein [Rhizobium sp. ARZ01]
MLSALSNINGAAHQVSAGRAQAITTRTEAAVAALAALSPAQPLPSVSDPFEDDDSFSFLYRPNGRPSGSDTSTSSTQSVADSSVSQSRLGMESTQLSSLLSSLMAPAATRDAAAPSTAGAPLPAVQESLIAKLYQQF